jgi:hypothetical protein
MKTFAIILALACALQGQTIVRSFDGIVGDGTGTVTHPNTTMDSNGTQVMEINQQTVAYYTTSGTPIGSTVDFLTWLANASPSIVCTKRTEPHVYYDSFIARWIVTYACNLGTDLGTYLFVSSGSDPQASTWKDISTLIPHGDATPRVGYSANWVVIAGFDSSCASKDSVVTFPASDLQWVGAGTISTSREQYFNCIELRTEPVIDLNASKLLTDPEFLFSVNSPTATANLAFNLQLRKLTGSNSGCSGTPPCMTLGSVTSISSGFRANATVNEAQPSGNPLNGTESFSTIYAGAQESGTHLYLGRGNGPCTASCSTQGVDSHMLFFWWDVNPNTLTITQSGKVSSAGTGYLFPTLAADSSGNLLIAATGVSSSQYPSIYTWKRLTTDTLGTLSGPTVQVTGTQAYGCNSANPTPWGNFYAATQDPTDGSKMWVSYVYGGSASNCVWKTRVLELQITAAAPSAAAPTGNFSNMQLSGAIQ